MQEKGLTNEGRHHLLYLHKQMHDKRGIIKSLIQYINQAQLPACEVGVFSGHMKKQKMKTETETGNENWKQKWKCNLFPTTALASFTVLTQNYAPFKYKPYFVQKFVAEVYLLI